MTIYLKVRLNRSLFLIFSALLSARVFAYDGRVYCNLTFCLFLLSNSIAVYGKMHYVISHLVNVTGTLDYPKKSS